MQRSVSLRQTMDCPPYGQVLLQGSYVPALRHPEYHIASDLALLYNLFLDSEKLLQDAARQKIRHSSEHSQSLGRSVILTCYNLLESFVSGLAAAFRIENPDAPEDLLRKLEGKRPKGGEVPLWERFVTFPALISGNPPLDRSKPVLKELFGRCKQRRDSFVHCEPGPLPTKRGYVKEAYFHDVDVPSVRQTVDLTLTAICQAWQMVHKRVRPTWLPEMLPSGRFGRVTVELRSID